MAWTCTSTTTARRTRSRPGCWRSSSTPGPRSLECNPSKRPRPRPRSWPKCRPPRTPTSRNLTMALPDKTLKLCSCHATMPAPEELARANFYGLLARLFYAPPDATLLERLAGAEDLAAEEGLMPEAWQALVWAAARADVDAVHGVYESAFVGTRKPLVSLHATAYTPRCSSKVPLLVLRADFAELGLVRHRSSHQPEDHIAGLCDVMRHLIQTRKRGLAQQGRFFNRWIA